MKRVIISLLAIVATASCTTDKQSGGESPSASFTSSITSRVTGTQWESGDQIGIMVTSYNVLLDDYRYNNLYDVSFSDPAQGVFTPASADDLIYYPLSINDYIDFYAYYPYSADLESTDIAEADLCYPIDVSDQQQPNAIDFMEASTYGSGGYNKYSGDVALTFVRNMTKVSLELVAGDGLALSDILAVSMSGFYTSANYYFSVNTFGDLGGDDVVVDPYSSGDYIYSAILIPANATSHTILFDTIYGDIELDLSDYTLVRGEHLYFTVTVSRTAASCQVNSIGDWDNANVDDNSFETE